MDRLGRPFGSCRPRSGLRPKKITGIPEAYVAIFKYGWLLSIDDGVGSVFAETGSLIDGMALQRTLPPVVSPRFVYSYLYSTPIAASGCVINSLAASRVLDSDFLQIPKTALDCGHLNKEQVCDTVFFPTKHSRCWRCM